MTVADQAGVLPEPDGQVPAGSPERPKRRTFTAGYKRRILAAYDELPEASAERGALLRRERLYHSHVEHWRVQRDAGTLAATTGRPGKDPKRAERAELARLRAENKKLTQRTEQLADQLARTRTALDIAGKAYALLESVSSSADFKTN